MQKSMGSQLKFSTVFHPKARGQSERTIQTLEDMLRPRVMDFCGSWSKKQLLIEFSCNNSYQASIGVAPYEVLYGRKCQSLIHWFESGENNLEKVDFIRDTTEAIKKVRDRMGIPKPIEKLCR